MRLAASCATRNPPNAETAKSGPDARPMVNWDVVGKNVDTLTVMIKQGWAKLTG